MNKTDALLWLMRAHEAIRKLPEDAEINSVEVTLYRTDGNRISVFLNGPTQIRGIVSKTATKYKDSSHGRVEVSGSSGVDYWWGCEFNDDGTIE